MPESPLPEQPQVDQATSLEALVAKQSSDVQRIVNSDAVLQGNIRRITNLEEFLKKLEQHKHLFDDTQNNGDNQAAREQFFSDHIQGFRYDAVTDDGRDFSTLSKSDLSNLTDNEYDRYRRWRRKEIEKKDQKISVDKSVVDEITMSTAKDNQHINQLENSNIDRKKGFEQLNALVQSAQSALSNAGKDRVEREINTLKSDPQALQALGIPEWEEVNPQYQDRIRASVLCGLAQDPWFAKQYVKAENQGEFASAIREIGKLGITPYAVQLGAFDRHIDARIPDGDEKSRVKEEVRSSVASGKVASILYDGKGEKYSLLYDDKKTIKEVVIHPPITRIRLETLAVSRETPRREISTAEKSVKEITKDIGKMNADVRSRPIVGDLAESQSAFVDDLEQGAKATDPKEQLISTYKGLNTKAKLLEDLITKKEAAWELVTVNVLRSSLHQVHAQIQAVGQLAIRYQNALEDREFERRNQTPDGFDETARDNLSWLVNNFFHRMGPSAQEALDRIVEWVNRDRDDRFRVRLGGEKLGFQDRLTLSRNLENLGGTKNVLQDGKQMATFQKKINAALSLPASHSGSIEELLSAKEGGA